MEAKNENMLDKAFAHLSELSTHIGSLDENERNILQEAVNLFYRGRQQDIQALMIRVDTKKDTDQRLVAFKGVLEQLQSLKTPNNVDGLEAEEFTHRMSLLVPYFVDGQHERIRTLMTPETNEDRQDKADKQEGIGTGDTRGMPDPRYALNPIDARLRNEALERDFPPQK